MHRLALVLVILFAVTPAFAQGEQATPSQVQADTALQQLQTDFNDLNRQQITVAVLQSQFNKELNQLKQMEVAFCDKYGLDVEKWRKGLYRFEPNENKFVEIEPTATEPATP